jgi:two-component system, NtrC family, sensor kinase
MMQHFGSRRSLFANFLIVGTTIGLTAMAYYSYSVIYNLTLTSLKQNALLDTQKGAAEIDSWLSNLKTHVETLANTDVVRSMDWSQSEPYLKTEMSRFEGIQTMAIGNAEGMREAIGAKPANVKDREYFQRAMAGHTNVSDPLITRALKKPAVMVATPIRPTATSSAKPIGELHTVVNLDRVTQVVERIQYGANSYAFALSAEGKAIVHPNASLLSTVEKPAASLLQASDPALAAIARRMVDRRQGMELVQIDGAWKYVAYLPLKESDWSIALVIPRENVESPLAALNFLAAVVAGLATMLILFLWRVQAKEKDRLQRSNHKLEDRVQARTAELSIALTQLQQSQVQLQQSNEVLEHRVQERTADLSVALNELQRSQLQLIQNEKMSSLGQLVAGVAHEINNPVNFIYGNLKHVNTYAQDLVDLINLYKQHYLNPPLAVQEAEEALDLAFVLDDMSKVFSSMKMGADRIKDIVLSLRTFSRMDEAELKSVDIHEGLNSTLVILDHRLKLTSNRPAIRVVCDYGVLPAVECYAGQLNQVFMNVLSNAVDAIEEAAEKQNNYQGEIIIRTLSTDSGWIKIAIADNGTGMSEMVKRDMFNPFFTTKPVGKGTGMGLGISYQIITEKHGGKLACFSKLGQGSELVIQIPIVLASAVKPELRVAELAIA